MTKQPKEKQVLIEFDSRVRIKEYDSMNVQIERMEERTYTKDKKKVTSRDWRFKAYAKNVAKALEQIQRNEWLIDYDDIHDLNSYLQEVKASAQEIKMVLE